MSFAVNWMRAIRCSTPVGIKGTITAARLANSHDELMCSTPVGIKGTITLHLPHFEPQGLYMCSTPVGIKGTITMRAASDTVNTVGAQRLSASKEQSHLTWDVCHFHPAQCSTPVGIKGTITIHANFLVGYETDGCSTPVGIKGTITELDTRIRNLETLCSTPVGIKGTITRRCAPRWFCFPCSTPVGIKGTITLIHDQSSIA